MYNHISNDGIHNSPLDSVRWKQSKAPLSSMTLSSDSLVGGQRQPRPQFCTVIRMSIDSPFCIYIWFFGGHIIHDTVSVLHLEYATAQSKKPTTTKHARFVQFFFFCLLSLCGFYYYTYIYAYCICNACMCIVYTYEMRVSIDLLHSLFVYFAPIRSFARNIHTHTRARIIHMWCGAITIAALCAPCATR